MAEPHHHEKIHIGMRNIKTACSATLCALLYFLLDRNPTFACIGAVFGMGSDMANSRLHGGNRLLGTIIGGLLGMGLFSIYIKIYPTGEQHLFMLVLLFAGIVLLILAGQLLHWPGAIQPGGVMLCILLFNQPVDAYVVYSLNRILDTAVGVLMSLAINRLLPREKLTLWTIWLCGGHYDGVEVEE